MEKLHPDGRQVIERWDRVFDGTSAEPRRQLIVALMDNPPNKSVALPESAINPNVSQDMERLRTQLIHSHLPKLEQLGYIEWDTAPFAATRGQRFDEIAVIFEALHSFAADIPDPLVVGCRRLETEREENHGD